MTCSHNRHLLRPISGITIPIYVDNETQAHTRKFLFVDNRLYTTLHAHTQQCK